MKKLQPCSTPNDMNFIFMDWKIDNENSWNKNRWGAVDFCQFLLLFNSVWFCFFLHRVRSLRRQSSLSTRRRWVHRKAIKTVVCSTAHSVERWAIMFSVLNTFNSFRSFKDSNSNELQCSLLELQPLMLLVNHRWLLSSMHSLLSAQNALNVLSAPLPN